MHYSEVPTSSPAVNRFYDQVDGMQQFFRVTTHSPCSFVGPLAREGSIQIALGEDDRVDLRTNGRGIAYVHVSQEGSTEAVVHGLRRFLHYGAGACMLIPDLPRQPQSHEEAVEGAKRLVDDTLVAAAEYRRPGWEKEQIRSDSELIQREFGAISVIYSALRSIRDNVLWLIEQGNDLQRMAPFLADDTWVTGDETEIMNRAMQLNPQLRIAGIDTARFLKVIVILRKQKIPPARMIPFLDTFKEGKVPLNDVVTQDLSMLVGGHQPFHTLKPLSELEVELELLKGQGCASDDHQITRLECLIRRYNKIPIIFLGDQNFFTFALSSHYRNRGDNQKKPHPRYAPSLALVLTSTTDIDRASHKAPAQVKAIRSEAESRYGASYYSNDLVVSELPES